MRLLKQTLLFVLLTGQLFAQKTLPRSTPEAEGVSSSGIIDFLDAVPNSRHELHSFMVLRHGKVVAEGWWNPYRPDLKHTMYSVSKSFTATAVGFAVSEGKLSVDDKVVSFFPGAVPDTISSNLSELRVKDLLSMSVGQEPDPTGNVAVEENWPKAFLKTPVLYRPGTKFLYNSAGTYMLSAIVQKVTGERIVDYLKPRLFDPLGIEGIDWETDPHGVNVGGWGLRLKTEDMAKFGQLFLQKGKWNGKQILPASWVEEASSKKIEQNPDARQSQKDSSDWLQGYGYQMWRSRHNSYRGDGAFGQFILIWPELDAVVVITAETPDMQSEFDMIWDHLYPAFKSGKLAADNQNLSKLKNKIASLKLSLPTGNTSAIEPGISGKTFRFDSNDRALKAATFTFNKGVCSVTLQTDSATYPLNFGSGKWEMGETKRYGPYLVARAKQNRMGLPAFKYAGSYSWNDEKTLELVLRYIESPHTETMRCSFAGNDMMVEFVSSFNPAAQKTLYKAVRAGN